MHDRTSARLELACPCVLADDASDRSAHSESRHSMFASMKDQGYVLFKCASW